LKNTIGNALRVDGVAPFGHGLLDTIYPLDIEMRALFGQAFCQLHRHRLSQFDCINSADWRRAWAPLRGSRCTSGFTRAFAKAGHA
jgi:hypothetical protein